MALSQSTQWGTWGLKGRGQVLWVNSIICFLEVVVTSLTRKEKKVAGGMSLDDISMLHSMLTSAEPTAVKKHGFLWQNLSHSMLEKYDILFWTMR